MQIIMGIDASRWRHASFGLLIIIVMCSMMSSAMCCSKSFPFNGSLHTFWNCLDLPTQGASIAWTFTNPNLSTSPHQGFYELELAFTSTAPTENGWVGWGLNPEMPQMVGSSVWVAYNAPNGSTLLPYRLTAATLGGAPLKCSSIDYEVKASAVQIRGMTMSMLLTLYLNASRSTTLYHVWNRGPSVSAFQPSPHTMQANNLNSVTQIDMSSAFHVASPSAPSSQTLKNRHGVINTITWGFLLPLGVMSARYVKPFADPQWFFMHISIQCAGYILGVSGWATGLQLERMSHGHVYQRHKYIGMVLFALSTLQVMALLVRPKKEHKIRKYWNIYHHFVGYTLISLGIVNVLIGLNILGAPSWARHSVICILAGLGAISFFLECITWSVFIGRRRTEWQLRAKSSISPASHKQSSFETFGPTEHILRVV